MLDLSYFQNQNSNVQGFFSGGTWQTWIKPRGAKLVNIICQGSGAGGGGGFQSAGGRAGGGGGGSGATARLTIDAKLLPDILYILPGIGGAGGIGGITGVVSSGTNGQNSFVTLIPSTGSISNAVLRSGTIPAVGGPPGAATNPGQLGVGETIAVIGNNIFANLGTFTFQAGVISNSSGTGNAGATAPGNFVTNAGGGGGTGTGGAVTATGVFPGITAAPVTTNGQDGPIYYKPILMLYGGRGGGGTSAQFTNGGNGGNGAPGTGGGGGGASSNTGVNAGNGGRGGDGFVIITTSL